MPPQNLPNRYCVSGPAVLGLCRDQTSQGDQAQRTTSDVRLVLQRRVRAAAKLAKGTVCGGRLLRRVQVLQRQVRATAKFSEGPGRA